MEVTSRAASPSKNTTVNNDSMKIIYGDIHSYCDDFKTAVDLFDAHLKEDALHYFQLAYESVNQSDQRHNIYESYCGFVRMLCGDSGGIELCRNAARFEKHNVNVFLNLARAEWQFKNRKKTIIALENGLKLNKKHSGLLSMRESMGIRSRKVIPIASRDSAINNALGKMLRKDN